MDTRKTRRRALAALAGLLATAVPAGGAAHHKRWRPRRLGRCGYPCTTKHDCRPGLVCSRTTGLCYERLGGGRGRAFAPATPPP